MSDSPPTTTGRASALAFATAFAALALQILVARIVSAKFLNNFAFLVISLTMLGFAFSGVLLTRWLPRFLARYHEAVNLWSALFVITTLGAAWLFYHAGVSQQRGFTRWGFITGFFGTLPFALLWAMPFACSGFILGMLLAAPGLPARRIYCADLLGSACGAFAVLPGIQLLGVEACMLAVCVIQALATFLISPPRTLPIRSLVTVGALLILSAGLFSNRFFELRHRDGSVLASTQVPGSGYVFEHAAWDPVSRVEVTRIPPPDPAKVPFPALIGDNAAFLARFKRIVTQNNFAFTYAVEYDGHRDSLAGIEQTIYSSAYQATSVTQPRVAILGVGGGFDVLTALYFDAAAITGVEINSATVKILQQTYAEYFRPWVSDPRVSLVAAEGRHYLSTHPERFDVLQLSGVDSYSGTPGAAHVFSESYLYTAEAFDLYLTRLTSPGILNVMRLEHIPPREMLRALTTAVAALRRAGIQRPAEHIIMVSSRQDNFTAMLVKKTPFTAVEEQRVTVWAATNKFLKIAAAPRFDPPEKNLYQLFLAQEDAEREQTWIALAPFNIAPVSDDEPFFFHISFWNHLWPRTALIRSDVPVMEISLISLGFVISVAVLVCLWLPLRLLKLSPACEFSRQRFGLIFAGTALGYLAIEIALLQKFGLFLGHPNYALSVVLAALLLASGLGALGSASLLRILRSPRAAAGWVAILLVVLHSLILPNLLHWIGLPFGIRALVVTLLVLPLGLLLGIFVPTALDQMKALGGSRFVPWAWGINGIFSVLAPILSIALSITWGINALLLAAIPLYLVVGFAFPNQKGVMDRAKPLAGQPN